MSDIINLDKNINILYGKSSQFLNHVYTVFHYKAFVIKGVPINQTNLGESENHPTSLSFFKVGVISSFKI